MTRSTVQHTAQSRADDSTRSKSGNHPGSTSRQLILNVNMLDFGLSAGAGAFAKHAPSLLTSSDLYVEVARIAERGRLDAFFLADNSALRGDPRREPGARVLEPTLILSTVAAATTHLGVIGTLSTTFNDPVELAERMLTLDHISGGRAAWNAVTSYNPAAGPNFGLLQNPDRELRYRRASEFVDVVLALWAGAVGGHTTRHVGEFFQVEGRLGLGASAQGHPLVVQAGGSPQGRRLAGRAANGVFSAEVDLASGIEHYELVKREAVAHGRRREDVAILPGLITTLGSTHAEAKTRADRLRDLAPSGQELKALSGRLGFDLSSLGLDDLIPAEALEDLADPAAFKESLGFRESAVHVLRKRRYTVREALEQFGNSTHNRIVGTPEDVADFMERWFRSGAADGFNLMPDAFSSGIEDFVDHVLPLLRARGLFRHEYEDTTLRGRWKLGYPASTRTHSQAA